MSRRAAPLAALLALVLTVLVAPPATADPPPAPRAAALDPVALQADLQKLLDAGGVGVVARVTDHGQSWAGALGEAASGVPATPEARFRAGSVTKLVTAVLALQRVEKGRWSMRTTIGDVLPELWPEHRDVTLRQLLSHTSGMPDFLPTYVLQAPTPKKFAKLLQQRRTDRELVGAAKGEDWLFEPGTSYGYSNTGFVVVGMMLEKASGTKLAKLAERKVFRPAGMTSSALARSAAERAPELVETAVYGGKPLDVSRTSPTLFSAAGSLVTTGADLERFHAALSARELIGKRQLRMMRSQVVAEEGYGLGSYRLPDPCAKGEFLFGHDGATFGTQTLSFTRPDGQTTVTLSMTGRDLDDLKAKQTKAMAKYLIGAFAQTC